MSGSSGWLECPECDGLGVVEDGRDPETGVWNSRDCDMCDGEGEISSEQAPD